MIPKLLADSSFFMPLTPQNMETRDGVLSHSIYRDIGRMDEEQLERYIRSAFTGNRDLSFLPPPFWDYFFDMDRHGDTTDGRDAPGPAYFFARIHDALGSAARGTFTIGSDREDKPDFGYRARFRGILFKLLEEAIEFTGKPTKEQKRLAAFAVETFGAMRSIDTFLMIGRQMGKEKGSASVEYPQYLIDDLGDLAEDRQDMRGYAEALVRSKRYGKLKLHYDSPAYLKR